MQAKSIHNFEGYVNDDDEENIDRDTPIDPMWEKQQKKTFTAWCNLHLKKINAEIKVIEEDFRSGLNLLYLLEVISGEELPKPEKGKMRVHKITNVNKALAFIQQKGVKLVSIGAEEIVDGNVKMTLGMIWTIILRFAIQNIQFEDHSANEGLLLWCQISTKNYENVNVKNFNTSFKDGLAFCGLINRCRPDLLDFKKLDQKNASANLNTAFEVAEKNLGIPKMLDVEDMLNSVKPDDRSVMAYVSCYYHVFAGAQKTSVAATRICKAIELEQMSRQLQDEYSTIFSDLKKWIVEKKKEFEKRDPLTSLSDVEKLFQTLRSYRNEDKPIKIEEKAKLETTFRTLQTRLRLNNRPSYVPPEGMLIADIILLWKQLEECEKAYEEWLVLIMKMMQSLDHWVRRFNIKCTTFEAWADGKPEILQRMDFQTSNLAEVRPMLKKHEAFESDLMAQHGRVERIQAIAQELQNLKYHDMPTIDARREQISKMWENIKRLSDKRRENLNNSVNVLEQIDAFQLEFAKRAAPFNNWIQQAEEDLQDTFIAHSTEEVEKMIDAHKLFKTSLDEQDVEAKALQKINSEIEELAKKHNVVVLENPYANVTPQELEDNWQSILKLAKERQQFLESAKERQLAIEELQRNFVKLANKLNIWLESTQQKVNNIGLGEGSLEDQLSLLDVIEKELTNTRTQLEESEQCNQKLQDKFVFEITCPVTMETLRSVWGQLLTGIKYTRNEIDNQILTRDSKGLSKSQLDDMRRCFNHFDKDKSNRLDMAEFKACLVSVGHSIVEEDMKKQTDKRNSSVGMSTTCDANITKLMHQLDPTGCGYISFDVFVEYMTRELTDMDTSDQLQKSFHTICGEKGYLTADDLRRELPPDQAEYCISQMKPITGPEGDLGALNFENYVLCVYGTK